MLSISNDNNNIVSENDLTTAYDDDVVRQADVVTRTRLPPSIGEVISRIWHSSSIQMALKRHFEFDLIDNAPYFLNQVRCWGLRLNDVCIAADATYCYCLRTHTCRHSTL